MREGQAGAPHSECTGALTAVSRDPSVGESCSGGHTSTEEEGKPGGWERRGRVVGGKPVCVSPGRGKG